MIKAIIEFFKKRHLLKARNVTFLVLILKSTILKELKEFKPISFSNFLYKIIIKILAERMKQFPDLWNNIWIENDK